MSSQPITPVRLRIERNAAVLENGCWEWTGHVNGTGYANICVQTDGIWVTRSAHRVAYEEWIGPIPEALVIDHKCHGREGGCLGGKGCRHRRCVNPAHLQAIAQGDNARRGMTGRGRGLKTGNSNKTHCKRGHAFDEANTRRVPGGRACRACERLRNKSSL